jgi:streptomycin 6-kinase
VADVFKVNSSTLLFGNDRALRDDETECGMHIPERLNWLRRHEAGRAWLANLPAVVSALAEEWKLELGAPFAGSNVSYAAAATRGTEQVVLKVQWPDDESAHEADALKVWNGEGAVRLLAHDAERHALLIERCMPGTDLAAAVGVDALAVLIALLPRLWKAVGTPFKSLTEEALGWAATLYPDWDAAGRPCERRLVDATAECLDQLVRSQGEQVLVHQDLHGENVLAAQREPWLVIDPKPLVGEREFSLAPIIRSGELGHSQKDVIYRLDRLSSELGLDRDRVRRWAIAQTVAWGFGSAYAAHHFETARWLLGAE